MAAANELSDAELRAASIRALHALPTDRISTAWVSGSLIERLGNPSSDVDIFVALNCTLDDIPLTRRAVDHGIFASIDGGVRYDIEFWTDQNISELAAKLDRLPIDNPKQNNLHFLSYWETEFIHRLLIGLPLFHEDTFVSVRARFDRKHFARFLMDTAVKRADDAFDDAVGMLQAGQTRMGALRARDALEFSADAFLHANGITNDKTKFRLKKLELLSEKISIASEILERLWAFESTIPNGELSLKSYAEDALRYSSYLVEMAQQYVRTADIGEVERRAS